MRTVYILAVLAALGLIGVVGWATLGSAQPVFDPPIQEIEPREARKSPAPEPKIIIPSVPATQSVDKPKRPTVANPNRPPVEPLPPPLVDSSFGIPKINEPPVKPLEASSLKIPEPIAPLVESPLKLPPINQLPPPVVSLPPPISPQPISGDIVAGSKSEPSVTLEWAGPNSMKAGVANDYVLVVRNTCSQPVQKVSVQMRAPTGVTVVSCEPKAEGNEDLMLWELGNLDPRQERRVSVKMLAPQRGDIACQASVTFTGSSVMKMRVREPKLHVKLQAPEKALVGDPTNFNLTISNPGDHATDRIKITAILAEGLESVRGSKVSFDVGTLAPGDSRTVTIPCVTKALGQQKCEVFAEADGGLKASDAVALNVVEPRLELAVTGPKMRYEGKKGAYTLKVTNPGDAPASNVFITKTLPSGFKFQSADSGGLHDSATRTVKWFVGELGAGESREVKIELLAIAQGEFNHKVIVHASRGMKAEQEFKSVVEGISAISMELVDTEDPVEVGYDTSYEIRIANTGTKPEADVKLVCTLPPQLKMKSVSGPLQYEVVGNEIVFKSLPRLAPRADVVVKITATAMAKGDVRFRASLTTESIIEPVTKVEVTKVYSE
jgi:uncharacterized repeat protein (TIGR01451 family)